MVLKANSRIMKNRNSSTFYLSIPADVAKDSQFPFHPNEEVQLEIKTADQTLVVYGINYKVRQTALQVKEKLKLEQKKKRNRGEK
jgi:hypothetical protein